MESIGDTVMKHGQPSLGERKRCVGEVLMYSRAAVHRRRVVTGQSRILIVQGAAGWFCSLGDPF